LPCEQRSCRALFAVELSVVIPGNFAVDFPPKRSPDITQAS